MRTRYITKEEAEEFFKAVDKVGILKAITLLIDYCEQAKGYWTKKGDARDTKTWDKKIASIEQCAKDLEAF